MIIGEFTMTSKDYLMQYKQLTTDINAALDAALVVQEEMKKQSLLNDVEGADSKQMQLHQLLISVHQMSDTRREIYLRIVAIPDIRQRQILELRYICGFSWSEISAMLYTDKRWILRQHLKALEEFDHQKPLDVIGKTW